MRTSFLFFWVRFLKYTTSWFVKISVFFREIIRRKAVQALYKFYLIAPNQVQHIHDKFRKALCDRDVGVMAASLHIYLEMIKVGKSCLSELLVSFILSISVL